MSPANKPKKIILSFSGGLDTSAIIPWIHEHMGSEVIAYCADLGNAPDAQYLEKWAHRLGASEFIFEDLKETFVTNFVYPALRAGAKYQESYLLGTALGRPLIAERLAFYAEQRGCDMIIHGATGKGNDQIRFENSIAYLAPHLQIFAPWRHWGYSSRRELVQYLASKGIEFQDQDKLYSEDVNLFHRSCEGGKLEKLDSSADQEVLKWTRTDHFPTTATTFTLRFDQAKPTHLNGEALASHELLKKLNALAGEYGIGVVDIVEDRMVGLKSRGVYETPGGTLLHTALAKLKEICWDRATHRLASNLSRDYADLIYDGFWHSDARFALDGFFAQASRVLSGEIELKLHPGSIECMRRSSPWSLYNPELVSFEQDSDKLNARADGFVKMLAVKQTAQGQRARQMKASE